MPRIYRNARILDSLALDGALPASVLSPSATVIRMMWSTEAFDGGH